MVKSSVELWGIDDVNFIFQCTKIYDFSCTKYYIDKMTKSILWSAKNHTNTVVNMTLEKNDIGVYYMIYRIIIMFI